MALVQVRREESDAHLDRELGNKRGVTDGRDATRKRGAD